MGKKISEERKSIIFDVYSTFEKYSDLKLRDIIRSGDESPIRFIYKIPEVLYMYMTYSIGIPKTQTKVWFKDEFFEEE